MAKSNKPESAAGKKAKINQENEAQKKQGASHEADDGTESNISKGDESRLKKSKPSRKE